MSRVVLWIEGEIPQDYDWSGVLPEGMNFVLDEDGEPYYETKIFPSKQIYHEVTWWITRRMTMDEWTRMDEAETNALSGILGDEFIGHAGPIPFSKENTG